MSNQYQHLANNIQSGGALWRGFEHALIKYMYIYPRTWVQLKGNLYLQHHLVNTVVQHLLVNFYLSRWPRPNPTPNPSPDRSPNLLGSSRSAEAVAWLRRLYRWRFSTYSFDQSDSSVARVCLQGVVCRASRAQGRCLLPRNACSKVNTAVPVRY